MSHLHPFPACPLCCAYHDAPLCVCNLVALPGNEARISLGFSVGLRNVYREGGMPPCVRTEKGSLMWSMEAESRSNEASP